MIFKLGTCLKNEIVSAIHRHNDQFTIDLTLLITLILCKLDRFQVNRISVMQQKSHMHVTPGDRQGIISYLEIG